MRPGRKPEFLPDDKKYPPGLRQYFCCKECRCDQPVRPHRMPENLAGKALCSVSVFVCAAGGMAAWVLQSFGGAQVFLHACTVVLSIRFQIDV